MSFLKSFRRKYETIVEQTSIISSTFHLLLVSTIMVSRIACFVGLVLVIPAVSLKRTLSLGTSFGSLRLFLSFRLWWFRFRLRMPTVKPALHITKNNSFRNVIENILVMFAVVQTLCICTWTKRPYRDAWINIAKLLKQAKRCTRDRSGFAALVDRLVANVTQ